MQQPVGAVGRTPEEQIINETIKPLNDDGTLKLIKVALSNPSSAQVHQTTAAEARRAMDVHRRSQKRQAIHVELEVVPLALSGESVDPAKCV